MSVCNHGYGFSIGRGSFHFTPGSWTHVRQTVVLNTPGEQDGDFTLEVDGVIVLHVRNLFYRGNPWDPYSRPSSGPTAPPDDGDGDGDENGLLGSLLGDLVGGLVSEDDRPQVRALARAQEGSSDAIDYPGKRDVVADSPKSFERRVGRREDSKPTGFKGVFFR